MTQGRYGLLPGLALALGGIRRTIQGVFEIPPRDEAPGVREGAQIDKTVRVVTTVEYRLED